MQVGDRIKLRSYGEIKALPGVYEEGFCGDASRPCLLHPDWHRNVVIKDSALRCGCDGITSHEVTSVEGQFFHIMGHSWTFHEDWVVGLVRGSTTSQVRHSDLRLIRTRRP